MYCIPGNPGRPIFDPYQAPVVGRVFFFRRLIPSHVTFGSTASKKEKKKKKKDSAV